MNTQNRNLALLLFLLWGPATSALIGTTMERFTGSVFPQDDADRGPVYGQIETVGRNGERTEIIHGYPAPDGRFVAYERILLIGGRMENNAFEIFSMDMADEILHRWEMIVIRQVREGKEEVNVHDVDENLIKGPLLPSFIERNRERLPGGDIVWYQLPYLDAGHSVPFELKQTGVDDGRGTLAVEMSLRDVLPGSCIDPIEFVIDEKSGRILGIHGPTIRPEPGATRPNGLLATDLFYTYANEEAES